MRKTFNSKRYNLKVIWYWSIQFIRENYRDFNYKNSEIKSEMAFKDRLYKLLSEENLIGIPNNNNNCISRLGGKKLTLRKK